MNDDALDIAGRGRTCHENAISVLGQIDRAAISLMQSWNDVFWIQKNDEMLSKDTQGRRYKVRTGQPDRSGLSDAQTAAHNGDFHVPESMWIHSAIELLRTRKLFHY